MEELENLIPSFRAALNGEVSKHRQVNGAGTLAAFVRHVNTHRDRYKTKIDSLRARNIDCDATQRAINEIADGYISNARDTGKVDF